MRGKNKNILILFISIVFILSNSAASQKAQLRVNDFANENVLHDAVRANDFTMVQYLVQQGVNINKQDEYGYTPLHLAVRLHQFDISSYLVEHKAFINTRDTYEDTPLIDATRNNDTNLSKLLICNGAKRDVVDAYGITTLQNSAKNKNQEIVTLLRVDNLEPYCQKKLSIDIDPFTITDTNYYKKSICGDILQGDAVNIHVQFTNKQNKIFGPYKANIHHQTKVWCIHTDNTKLKYGTYTVEAIATDHVINTDRKTQQGYVYAPKLDPKISIDIKYTNTTLGHTPTICGKIIDGEGTKGNATIIDSEKRVRGTYKLKIDSRKQNWCFVVRHPLENGTYTVKVNAKNKRKISVKSIQKIEVYVIKELYDDLMREFKYDFKSWNAHLDKNTLTVSFRDPKALFAVGKDTLNQKFKNILNDFFPRYIKITSKYKQYIQKIIIEGHSSPENSFGDNKMERFRLNKILSQNRADKVLSYTNNIIDKDIGDNILWIIPTFKANGLSSLYPIYNQNGSINKKQSRRVEFRIVNTRNSLKEPGE